MNMTLKFSPIEDIAIRNKVDELTAKGESRTSVEPCTVCSTPLLSLVITTSKGIVNHYSCPSCGERDIKLVLEF